MEAAFFDLDKTVIAKASMVAFGRPLLKAGMISRWLMVRALWSNLVFHYLGADERRMRKFRESALRITRGWEQTKISALVRDNLTEVIEPIVYDEALALMHEHQAAGRLVFIISASPEEIVAPLALYLGVDQAIATRAEIDDEGRYTGDVEFYSYGSGKADAMREIAGQLDIDLDASFAYSDSITDLPMLEVVGHPTVVNPDRELARIARERGWHVEIFQQGVPLRERVAMPPPRHLVIIAAVGLAAACAGIAWRSLRREPEPPASHWPSWWQQQWQQVARRVPIIELTPPRPSRVRAVGMAAVLRRPAASSQQMRRVRGRRWPRGASSWGES